MGSTERGAFRTRRLLWINKLGRFHHLTTVSLGNRLDGFHIGAKYRQSEFAIRGGIRVKVNPKHLQQFINFPSKEGEVASCKRLFCSGSVNAGVSARFCISRSERPNFGGSPIWYGVVYSMPLALSCWATL